MWQLPIGQNGAGRGQRGRGRSRKSRLPLRAAGSRRCPGPWRGRAGLWAGPRSRSTVPIHGAAPSYRAVSRRPQRLPYPGPGPVGAPRGSAVGVGALPPRWMCINPSVAAVCTAQGRPGVTRARHMCHTTALGSLPSRLLDSAQPRIVTPRPSRPGPQPNPGVGPYPVIPSFFAGFAPSAGVCWWRDSRLCPPCRGARLAPSSAPASGPVPGTAVACPRTNPHSHPPAPLPWQLPGSSGRPWGTMHHLGKRSRSPVSASPSLYPWSPPVSALALAPGPSLCPLSFSNYFHYPTAGDWASSHQLPTSGPGAAPWLFLAFLSPIPSCIPGAAGRTRVASLIPPSPLRQRAQGRGGPPGRSVLPPTLHPRLPPARGPPPLLRYRPGAGRGRCPPPGAAVRSGLSAGGPRALPCPAPAASARSRGQ